MTTVVLIHPSEHCPTYQVFAVYDAPGVHHVFDIQEIDKREDAEWRARGMMETYDADHFRRVIVSHERIG